MDESKSEDYISCCRLCLGTSGPMKFIFEDSTNCKKLVQDILAWLSIEIRVDDKVSKNICEKCTEKLKEWIKMRKLVGMNQLKLLHQMNMTQNDEIDVNMSIHIKDELIVHEESISEMPIEVTPSDDDDIDITDDALPNGVEIKSEPVEELSPPLLSPYTKDPIGETLNENMSTPNNNNNTKTIEPAETPKGAPSPQMRLPSPDPNSPDKPRYCRICNKLFSSVNNRLRHEKNIHRVQESKNKNSPSLLQEIAAKRKKYLDSLPPEDESIPSDLNEKPPSQQEPSVNAKAPPDETEPVTPESETPPPELNSVEIEKTQFAAELQLLRRDAVSNLTKTEQFYVEKFKGLLASFKTLKCVCHNMVFMKRKEVVKHLRYFFGIPIYTCFNCMISYPSRSTFQRRATIRCKRDMANMVRVTQLRENSASKIRAYHNLVCRECNFTFFFVEDIREHIDREHVQVNGPFQCSVCSSLLGNMDEYKEHLYGDCLVAHACDVCSTSYPTVESFEEHAKQDHDKHDITPKQKMYIGLLKDVAVAQSKPEVDMPSVPDDSDDGEEVEYDEEDDDDETVPNPAKKKKVAHRNRKPLGKKMQLLHKSNSAKFNPAKCDICGKRYSNIYNLRRHQHVHQGQKNIECEHCFAKFRIKQDLNDHMVDVHGFDTPKRPKVDENFLKSQSTRTRIIKKPAHFDNTAIYSCPDCGKLFESLGGWKEHRAEHNEYVCNECGLQFERKSDLEQHRSQHLNLKLYRDPKSSSYKAVTGGSPPPVTAEASSRCQICDKTFASSKALQAHKALHRQMPTLTPQDGLQELETKQKSFAGARDFSCSYCSMVFDTYKRMWNHKRAVHEPHKAKAVLSEPNSMAKPAKPLATITYPRKCELCSKILSTYSSYWKHRKRHLREQLSRGNAEVVAATNEQKVPQNAPAPIKWPAVKAESSPASALVATGELYKCKLCSKMFASKLNRNVHMKMHKPARKYDRSGKFVKNLTCEICNTTCLGMAELKKHKNNEHFVGAHVKRALDVVSDSPKSPQPIVVHPEEAKTIQCGHCDAKFMSTGALRKHISNKHAENGPPGSGAENNAVKVYCKYCGMGFRQTHLLDLHVQKEHPDFSQKDKKYMCDICNKICDSPMSLIVHKGWHKRSSDAASRMQSPPHLPYRCTSCSESFENDTALQIHILKTHRAIEATIHTTPVAPPKPQAAPQTPSYTCDKCRFVFKSGSEYEQHMRLHEAMGSQKCLACRYCDKKFSRSDSLSQHVKKAHGGQQQGAPVEHLVVEPLLPMVDMDLSPMDGAGGKIYPCNYCNKVFDRSQSLALHRKMHERELGIGGGGGSTGIIINPASLLKPKNNHQVPAVASPAWYYSCTACNVHFDSTKKLRVHMLKKHH